MAVGAHPSWTTSSTGGVPPMFAEQPGVLLGARSEIAPLDRHRMELRGVQHRGWTSRSAIWRAFASFIVLRHDPLIDLEHLQSCQWTQSAAGPGASATACARRSGQRGSDRAARSHGPISVAQPLGARSAAISGVGST